MPRLLANAAGSCQGRSVSLVAAILRRKGFCSITVRKGLQMGPSATVSAAAVPVAASKHLPRSVSPAHSNSAYIDKDLTVQGASQGPLHGLTFALKDLFDVKGHRTGFGNPVWLETHGPAENTSAAVQALLDAGASLHGKAHMDELAYSLNGENVHYGTPENPAAPGHIPGGSSSGSASAVAAGDVDFSIGSDTGGSIRVPASYCGLLGMRPTHGRVSLQHARSLAPSYCTCGWFARSPSILRRVGEVLLLPQEGGAEPAAGTLQLHRWLVVQDAFELAEPAATEALYSGLSRHFPDITALLGAPTEISLAGGACGSTLKSLTDWADVFRITQGAEVWRQHGEWISAHEPGFGPGTRERFEMAAGITAQQEQEALVHRAEVTKHVRELIGRDSVLVIPTAPGPAPACKTPSADLDQWRRQLLGLTCIAGLAGLPQVSLPIAQVNGLPVGLSLIGPAGSDEALLQLTERLMALLVVKEVLSPPAVTAPE